MNNQLVEVEAEVEKEVCRNSTGSECEEWKLNCAQSRKTHLREVRAWGKGGMRC
jgi:hypothetical protein